jgi:hypothetical protein
MSADEISASGLKGDHQPHPPSLEEQKLSFEQTLERDKLILEQQKFEFEKSKTRGLGFFNANLGIIITAIIGSATIIVSYLQLEITRNTTQAQLALDQSKVAEEKNKYERTIAL